MTALADDRYIVISSDGHVGGQMHEYRDHLESKYHAEFDEWVKTYVNPFEDLRSENAYRNWDSRARLRELEGPDLPQQPRRRGGRNPLGA